MSSKRAPGPSAEERGLQAEQTALLRDQRDLLQRQLSEQNLLFPVLLEQQGLQAISDPAQLTQQRTDIASQLSAAQERLRSIDADLDGGTLSPFVANQRRGELQKQIDTLQRQSRLLTGTTGFAFTPEALAQQSVEQRIRQLTLGDIEAQAALAPQEQQIRQLQTERQLAALRGELPVDPALERSLGEQEQTLRERLFAQLGPGFETSTPGIQTLAEFGKRGEELRSAARRAELTVGEQLRLAGESGSLASATGGLDVTQRLRDSRLGNIFGASQFFSPVQGSFGGLAQGFGGAAGSLSQERLIQQQFAAQQSQGTGALLGTVLGGGLGFFLGGPYGAAAGATIGSGIGRGA